MTAPISVTAMPKWKKYSLLGLVLVVVIGVIYLAINVRFVKSSVTDYAITRTCDFVTVGNLTGIFCTDGSNWQVTAIDPLVP